MHNCSAGRYVRIRLVGIVLPLLMIWTAVIGQELEPRAYASAPVGLHALLGVYSRSDGSVLLDPTLPAENITSGVNAIAIGYFQSIDFFGRFANIGLYVPYAWGSIQGLWENEYTQITRSGLGDPRLRLALNLTGAPALKPAEFVKYQQKTNLGLSFTFLLLWGSMIQISLLTSEQIVGRLSRSWVCHIFPAAGYWRWQAESGFLESTINF